jgi:hypothetical protein
MAVITIELFFFYSKNTVLLSGAEYSSDLFVNQVTYHVTCELHSVALLSVVPSQLEGRELNCVCGGRVVFFSIQ